MFSFLLSLLLLVVTRDVLPTSLLKSISNVFSPVIAKLANISFLTGEFLSTYKTAQVFPLFKNPGLDQHVSINYRSITNFHTVSKIMVSPDISDIGCI